MPSSLASRSPFMSASYGYVVGGGKMDLQHISELVAFGRGEDDAGTQTIKVHPPMGGVRRGGTYWVSAQSTRKLANAWDLMAVRGW